MHKDLDHYFDQCLYFCSQDFSRLMTKLAEEVFMSTTLSPSYAILMMAIEQKEKCGCVELSQISRLTPSTITRLTDKLILKGLVSRQQDGRNTCIKLTPKGKEMMPLITQAWEKLYELHCKILGEDFVEKLTDSIAQANQILREKS